MKPILHFRSLSLILFLVIGQINPVLTQDGTLDNTFSSDGKVTTDFNLENDQGYGVAIQQDGKIVVAGSANNSNGSSSNIALARYNVDGSLDNGFGSNGKVTTSFASGNSNGYGLAIQNDGKIVVAGSANNGSNIDFALVRYNVNGALDNTFDSDGKVITPIGSGHDLGKSVAIQSDGKIVVAGNSANGGNDDLALVRYNTNGSLDNTFGSNGKVILHNASVSYEGLSIVLQTDGKILVTGSATTTFYSNVLLIRCNNNGTLDNSFGSNGIVLTNTGFDDDYGRSVITQPDGKILVTGYGFTLVRYNNNGTLDNNFGTNGIIPSISSFNGYSLCLQADGKILVAGNTYTGSNYKFALIRYNDDGTSDNGFGSNGFITSSIGSGSDYGYSITTQSDGKIVFAGKSFNGNNYDFAVVRYNNPSNSTSLLVNIKAYLEGPFNTSSMYANLDLSGQLTHPYSLIHNGTESVSAGLFSSHPDIVDWIVVELRTHTSESSKIASRACFLKSDGSIVDLDGTSNVEFTGIDPLITDCYIVIHHRNHLPVMSAQSIPIN